MDDCSAAARSEWVGGVRASSVSLELRRAECSRQGAKSPSAPGLRVFARQHYPFNARQTFSGVAGMSKVFTPSASVTAFMKAAGAAIAPASPQPLTPSGFDGQAVIVMPTL